MDDAIDLFGILTLDHHAQQRLGTRRAQQNASTIGQIVAAAFTAALMLSLVDHAKPARIGTLTRLRIKPDPHTSFVRVVLLLAQGGQHRRPR